MNYASLTAQIQDVTQNTETSFVASIPSFVQRAEERVYRAVDFPALKANVSGSMTALNRFMALPDDFIYLDELATVVAGEFTFLLRKNKSFLREAYPSLNTTGLPRYYSIYDQDTLELAPVPDLSYVVELHYQMKPESIVTTSTSWLGDNCENVLLYASIIEAYVYMKGSADVMALYEKRLAESIQDLTRLGIGYLRRDSYSDEVRRIEP